MVYSILVIVQVVVALSLVVLILLQHGKGADAGAAFGSGASGTVFGAKGSANFMSHATAGLAVLFMLASLTLAYLVNGGGGGAGTGSVTDQLTEGGKSSQSAVVNTHSGDTGAPSEKKQGATNSATGAAGGGAAKPANKQSNDNGPKIPD